jgi:cellulose synthase/poly-beta-1,6-N-acetylglucosamine synthase-like glycosyltransferase
LIASAYPFLEVFWTMLIFFAFFIWIWILFTVFADLFRRDDISGWGKAAWIIFVVVLPYLGVFVYLVAEHKGMTERTIKQQQAADAEMSRYVKSVAGKSDPTAQIANAKALLDQGAISQTEFDQIKQKALAG